MSTNPVYEIIGRWPKRADLASDLGGLIEKPVSVDMVHKWAVSGIIPAPWQPFVLRAAESRGIQLTPKEVIDAHEKGAA